MEGKRKASPDIRREGKDEEFREDAWTVSSKGKKKYKRPETKRGIRK